MEKILFRVASQETAQCKNTGDLLQPGQQNKYRGLDPSRTLFLSLVDERRPEHVERLRSEYLFLFERIEDAENYKQTLLKTNPAILEVKVEEKNIIHRGDYSKFEETYQNFLNNKMTLLFMNGNPRYEELLPTIDEQIFQYWNRELTENPIIEVMVIEAEIVSIL